MRKTDEVVFERSDVFVISNATTDYTKLIAFVKQFNQQQPPNSYFEKYFSYSRIFYRESQTMQRDYEERYESYFDIDRLDDHGEDMILVVLWWNYGTEVEYQIP